MQRLPRHRPNPLAALVLVWTCVLAPVMPSAAQPVPAPSPEAIRGGHAASDPDVVRPDPRRVGETTGRERADRVRQAARERAEQVRRERAARAAQDRPSRVEPERAGRAQPSRRAPSRRAASRPSTLTLNQKRARIEQLVQKIGEAAGRTILVPDDVRGNVTIIAKRPMTIDESWAVLETALSLLGHSLLPGPEGVWRIAKVADAVGEAPFERVSDGRGESFVTTLIPLRTADVEDVMPVLEPLSGSRVTLVPFAETNSIIASGSEVAIARLTTLADELDRIEEQTLRIRVLRHRGVEDVEGFVEEYLESGDYELQDVQVWSDLRTNSLAVRGSKKGVDEVVAFIEDVDQPIERGGAIRILRVLNRDPEEVAELIRSLSNGTTAATTEAASVAGPLDGADYTIAVDAPSRSLVVKAPPEAQGVIREVVELLDQSPQLVAVDITVSELRMPEAYGLATGFSLPFTDGSDGNNDLVGVVVNEASSAGIDLPPTVVGRISRDTGVAFQQNVNGNLVSVPILQSGTIAGVDFEATNEVLIQPSLVVTAGDQHEIFVGNNVPIPVTDSDSSGLGANTVAGVNIPQISRTTNFDRRDIGTRVTLEATTGTEGKIQLDLEIELSNIDLTRANLGGDAAQVGPSYVEQSLVTTARLDDGETAILAVNTDKKTQDVETGVPFFRSIPFLGRFFRSTGTVVDDIKLVIAVRVRRISNPSELVADTIRRRLVFERRASRATNLPLVEGPPYGVRVTTRVYEEDATAIADSIASEGLATRVHGWSTDTADYWDVYVTGLPSMVDAGVVARELAEQGWETDLVVFSKRR
ncbi:MAG: hypothetical protein NXI30_16795 [bacterium]|nr:hypothetical protein [bacterium]